MGQHTINRGIHGNPPTRMQRLGKFVTKGMKVTAITIPTLILSGYMALVGLNYLSFPRMEAREKWCRPIDEAAQSAELIGLGDRICGKPFEAPKEDPKEGLHALIKHFESPKKIPATESKKAIVNAQLILHYYEREDCSATQLTDDGWVATAAHCIFDVGEIGNYGLEKGKVMYEITDIVMDKGADIALLKADIPGLPHALPIAYFLTPHQKGKVVTVVANKDGAHYESSGNILDEGNDVLIGQGDNDPRELQDGFIFSAKTENGHSGGAVVDKETGAYAGVVSAFEKNGNGIAGKTTYLKRLIQKHVDADTHGTTHN